MFAYLIGRVAGVTEDNLVLEVGQIGFNVKIPASLPSLLPPVGGEVKIYTYTCVREDAFQLYGFLSQDELDMFRLLITVSGIGPKGGLAILSAMSADDVRLAVLTQDAKAIARAPGVGPKTAQRLILELKDKISMEDTFVSRRKRGLCRRDLRPDRRQTGGGGGAGRTGLFRRGGGAGCHGRWSMRTRWMWRSF